MESEKGILNSLGGKRRAVYLLIIFLGATAFLRWQSFQSGNALTEIASELDLEVTNSGQRTQINGRIGEIGVAIKTTTENTGGETRWFTDFQLYAPDQPSGTIVAATLREKWVGGLQDTEWLTTGEESFDEAVLVAGDPAEILPRLDASARDAVERATDAGWTLERSAWKARGSGRMTDPGKIRDLLDLGLAAARSLQEEGTAASTPDQGSGPGEPASK